jgi:hypothetical protein
MAGCKLQKVENHCHGVYLNAVNPVFVLIGAVKRATTTVLIKTKKGWPDRISLIYCGSPVVVMDEILNME